MKQRLTPHDLRRIAVASGRDPRTVQNVIDGKAKPTPSQQVREAASQLGYELPSPPSEGSTPPRAA